MPHGNWFKGDRSGRSSLFGRLQAHRRKYYSSCYFPFLLFDFENQTFQRLLQQRANRLLEGFCYVASHPDGSELSSQLDRVAQVFTDAWACAVYGRRRAAPRVKSCFFTFVTGKPLREAC